MKKKTILFVSLLTVTGLASAQLGAFNKAKSLVGGSKSSNSGTNNNSNSNTNTNNSSGTTTPTTPASTTPSSNTGSNTNANNAAKPAATAPQDAVVAIYFLNSTGQKSTSFSDGDVISAHIDFTQAMKDIGGKKYNDVFILNVLDGTKFLNGKRLDSLKDDVLAKSSFDFQAVCSIDQAKSKLAEAFTKTLAQQLGKGKHSIKFRLSRYDKYNNELIVAEGTFDYDLTNGKDKLRAQADSYDAKEIAARRMPKAVMKNAAIEKDLMNLISYDFTEPVTPLRAVIDNSDWEIQRDDYNKIIRRVIGGYVAIKVPRNGRCFYKHIYIYQPYAGGGTYGKSQYFDNRVSADLLEIKYENVMK